MEYKSAISFLNLYVVTFYYSNDEEPIQHLLFNDGSKDVIDSHTVI